MQFFFANIYKLKFVLITLSNQSKKVGKNQFSTMERQIDNKNNVKDENKRKL